MYSRNLAFKQFGFPLSFSFLNEAFSWIQCHPQRKVSRGGHVEVKSTKVDKQVTPTTNPFESKVARNNLSALNGFRSQQDVDGEAINHSRK